jgi:hypothetical protein
MKTTDPAVLLERKKSREKAKRMERKKMRDDMEAQRLFSVIATRLLNSALDGDEVKPGMMKWALLQTGDL